MGQRISAKRVQEFHLYNVGTVPKPEPKSVGTPAPPPPPQRPAGARPADIHDLLNLPPRPFAVPIPAPAAPVILDGWQRTVVYGDTHIPYHDNAALALVQRVVLAADATRIIHLGDLLDCEKISRFPKDPNRLFSQQDEIDTARVHLHQMAQLAPHTERWLLEGNHEDRLRKAIWDLPGGAQELMRLTRVREAAEWPILLGLDEIGWRWLSSRDQTRTSILPKLIVKHGTVVRKWSAATAKGEWEKYGRGGISGHTHRLGKFYHRDHNGAHLWTEAGCTCSLDPHYMLDPDWNQGCLVVTHTPDGERYAVEDVYFQDGIAIWRGNEFRAA